MSINLAKRALNHCLVIIQRSLFSKMLSNIDCVFVCLNSTDEWSLGAGYCNAMWQWHCWQVGMFSSLSISSNWYLIAQYEKPGSDKKKYSLALFQGGWGRMWLWKPWALPGKTKVTKSYSLILNCQNNFHEICPHKISLPASEYEYKWYYTQLSDFNIYVPPHSVEGKKGTNITLCTGIDLQNIGN